MTTFSKEDTKDNMERPYNINTIKLDVASSCSIIDRIMSIKILDASILLTGTDAQKSAFCEALVDGFSNQGMVKLVNHGLDNSKIQGIFDWVWLTALHF